MYNVEKYLEVSIPLTFWFSIWLHSTDIWGQHCRTGSNWRWAVCLSVFFFPSQFPLFFLFWPGFQAGKEPQSKSRRPYLLISVAILLRGSRYFSSYHVLFLAKTKTHEKCAAKSVNGLFWTIRLLKNHTNEYVFLPQSWRVCLVTDHAKAVSRFTSCNTKQLY